jgi:ERCC4-type nuclease
MSKEALIIIDSKEQDNRYFVEANLMKKFDRSNIQIENLEVGDYQILNSNSEIKYVIERKTVNDFISSFVGKEERLKTQISKLTDYYGVIAVVGNIYDLKSWKKHTRFKSIDSITRLLTSLTVKFDKSERFIRIVQVPDENQLVIMLDHIASKIEKGEILNELGVHVNLSSNVSGIGSVKFTEIISFFSYFAKKPFSRMTNKELIKMCELLMSNEHKDKLKMMNGIGKNTIEKLLKYYEANEDGDK